MSFRRFLLLVVCLTKPALGEPVPGGDVRVESLEKDGLYRATTLPEAFAQDPLTLLALKLNGEELSPDHGYPCRLIAPNRPGVLQTKWVTSLEVQA
jgi:DMSO/TMAO reductase YedYZ molybdopterin-dependent catalytic subunit